MNQRIINFFKKKNFSLRINKLIITFRLCEQFFIINN